MAMAMPFPLRKGESVAERVLGFAEALGVVLAEARGVSAPSQMESVALLAAIGRVLATAVKANRDQPPFDRATRDGYALRAAGAGGALRVLGQVRAGEAWSAAPLGAGEAIEIMTGAPLPQGADCVVMVEHTATENDMLWVEAGRSLKAGENVVAQGAEARAGARLLPPGRVIGAAEVAVAASCGRAELPVLARPKVAIVATGDELVELGELAPSHPTHDGETVMNGVPASIGDSQIYNSNSYALAALVRGEGGEAKRLAVARDTLESLRERLAEARGGDLLLLSGGVSMGKYDLVEQVLTEAGAEFFFTGALIQPGKPVVFGQLADGTYFFGLPGNPVSTQVCFHLFVAPLLRAMAGRIVVAPIFSEARLVEDVRGGAKVTRFLPAEMTSAWDGVTVKVVGWQGSGDVSANARGNCYCVLPAGVEGFAKGESVRVLLR
jgi:molybdopterin molybdotransferase